MASVPRLYQLELAELAAGQNLIVNLPTGAGKTLIASLVVSHYADELLAAASRGVRLHIVFLAPRRTLVHQQAGVLDACCPLRVRTFTAESCVDFWDRAAWEHELSLADVLVATPAVVLDALNKAYLRLADVLLLVLDEAHNAAKSDPAAVLMREHYARADPVRGKGEG